MKKYLLLVTIGLLLILSSQSEAVDFQSSLGDKSLEEGDVEGEDPNFAKFQNNSFTIGVSSGSTRRT